MDPRRTERGRTPEGAGDGPLWVIACHFNPFGWRRRRRNFETFARRLGAPLLAVELSCDGRFELPDDAADHLLRVRGGDVLWQKERLLNLALAALPRECEYVAWLDGDIVFADPDWTGRVCDGLRRHALVQVFDRLLETGPGESVDALLAANGGSPARCSLVSGLREGRFGLDVFSRLGGSLDFGYSPGHGWAARRELLDEHGLYDAFVLGTGDKAVVAAAYGQIGPFVASLEIGARFEEQFRAWAEPFARVVAGDVGFCRNTIVHLWHGELGNRRYGTRYREFSEFGFDPYRDIEQTSSGAWRWNSAKPAMHAFVHGYLESRREDGLQESGVRAAMALP